MSTPKKKISDKDREAIDNAMHHIRTWRGRPYWLKMRIDQGPKYVGKDVYVPLQTSDLKVAKRIRDVVLVALQHGGFVCLRHEIQSETEMKKGA